MLAADIVGRVTTIVEQVASLGGMEVVEIEWKGGGNSRMLRIFIDKPGGVSLTDCEQVSRQVGTVLDVEEVIPTRYTLEVSSPGLDRKLMRPADYQRFLGRKARIRLNSPMEGQLHYVGWLRDFQGGLVGLELEGGRRVEFPLEEVQTARLVVEFGGASRPGREG